MNILFLDQFSDPGGAQQCLLDLWPAVRARGWQALYGLPGDGWLVRGLRARGAEVAPVSSGSYSSGRKPPAEYVRFAAAIPRLASRIRSLAERARADLIYVNGPRVLPAAAHAARGRWPLVFHCHSHLTSRCAAWLCARALRQTSAHVIACSRSVAAPLDSGIGPGRLHVVYNGVAGGLPRCRRAPPWRIGVVGRIAPENGQAEFLRAARLLARARNDLRFVVCGAPLFASRPAQRYARSLHALAAGLPVQFPGWREDVAGVLAELDVLAVPALGQAGAPRVILEAYASGVPVVAFVSGGIPEIVSDGQTGLLVTPPTPEALARRIAELLENPEALCRMAERGLAVWQERFTLERYQREVLAVLEELGPVRELRPASPKPAQPPAA